MPEHLRDSHYKGAERLGHGKGYQYAHDGKEHFVAQDYLGATKRYYEPTEQGVEKKIKERPEINGGRSLRRLNQPRMDADEHGWKWFHQRASSRSGLP